MGLEELAARSTGTGIPRNARCRSMGLDKWITGLIISVARGCQFDQLEYLGLEQVGQAATQGDGVRFKVMDD